jgi:hypothetical protein
MYNFAFWGSSCCFEKSGEKGGGKREFQSITETELCFSDSSFKVPCLAMKNLQNLSSFDLGS